MTNENAQRAHSPRTLESELNRLLVLPSIERTLISLMDFHGILSHSSAKYLLIVDALDIQIVGHGRLLMYIRRSFNHYQLSPGLYYASQYCITNPIKHAVVHCVCQKSTPRLRPRVVRSDFHIGPSPVAAGVFLPLRVVNPLISLLHSPWPMSAPPKFSKVSTLSTKPFHLS